MTAELGVGRVLEGSVRQNADQIRVTAQLIDAATNEQIWSGEYDPTVNNLFTVQGEIALRTTSSRSTSGSRASLAVGRLVARNR